MRAGSPIGVLIRGVLSFRVESNRAEVNTDKYLNLILARVLMKGGKSNAEGFGTTFELMKI